MADTCDETYLAPPSGKYGGPCIRRGPHDTHCSADGTRWWYVMEPSRRVQFPRTPATTLTDGLAR